MQTLLLGRLDHRAFGYSRFALLLACSALSILAGCAVLARPNENLESARSDFRSAQKREDVFLLAGPEIDEAREALRAADTAWRHHSTKAHVDDLALRVTRRVALARQAGAERALELRERERELEKSGGP